MVLLTMDMACVHQMGGRLSSAFNAMASQCGATRGNCQWELLSLYAAPMELRWLVSLVSLSAGGDTNTRHGMCTRNPDHPPIDAEACVQDRSQLPVLLQDPVLPYPMSRCIVQEARRTLAVPS